MKALIRSYSKYSLIMAFLFIGSFENISFAPKENENECPPCKAANSHLKLMFSKWEQAEKDKKGADHNLKAAETEKDGMVKVVATYCSGSKKNSDLCKLAKELLGNAETLYKNRQKQLSKATKKLHEVKPKYYAAAQRSLKCWDNEPNKCQLCTDGKIQPVDQGPVPGNKCLECDGKGNEINNCEEGEKCCKGECVKITYYVMQTITDCNGKATNRPEPYDPTKDYRYSSTMKNHYATDRTFIKCSGESVRYGPKTEDKCK